MFEAFIGYISSMKSKTATIFVSGNEYICIIKESNQEVYI